MEIEPRLCVKDPATEAVARLWSVILMSVGVVMNVIDANVIYIVLPRIQTDLKFSEASLVWVVNAQFFTYAAFLLLSGRLSDFVGPRRVFLCGEALFTLGSLGCGLASTQELFLGARAAQGIGGALVSTAAFALVLDMFTQDIERTKVLSLFASVSAGGECVALLLGSLLMSVLDWRGVFLINLPLGATVCAVGSKLLSDKFERSKPARLDIVGAVTSSASLIIALWAAANVNDPGVTSRQTYLSLIGSAALMVSFFIIEAHSRNPLIPLGLLSRRNFLAANGIGILLSVAVFSWGFVATLYMQLVLGYSPLKVALAYLPGSIVTAFSATRCANLISRFGIKATLIGSFVSVTAGLTLLARAPATASLAVDVLPSMLLIGSGSTMAYTTLSLASFGSIRSGERGIASGVMTTSTIMGGLLGLSVLINVAARRTNELRMSGSSASGALNEGYHEALFIAAVCTVVAALMSGVFLRPDRMRADVE